MEYSSWSYFYFLVNTPYLVVGSIGYGYVSDLDILHAYRRWAEGIDASTVPRLINLLVT